MDDHLEMPHPGVFSDIERAAERPPVQAVRSAHGGYPDPSTPTVEDRLAEYLRSTGHTIRLACLPEPDPDAPLQFGAIATHYADTITIGATPFTALDQMLAKAGR